MLRTVGQLLPFEWRYLTRNLTFAGVATVIAAMALVMVRTGYGGDAQQINSPYSVMQSFGLLTLWCLFMQTIFCVRGVLRDDEHQMRELIFSRPIPLSAYVLTRFTGQVLAGIAVMVLVTLVLMFAPEFVAKDPERVGPLRFSTYGWAFATLVLPNLMLIAALLFAVAATTRSAMATYIGGIGIFAMYMVTALLVDSPLLASSGSPTPDALARAALLDPFGLSAFAEQARYWTPAERDVRLVALEGRYLLNRVLWLAIGAGVLAATYRFAPWTSSRRPATPRKQRAPDAVSAATHAHAAYRPVVAQRNGLRSFVGACLTSTRFEVRRIFSMRAVQLLLFVWLVIAFTEARTQLIQSEYGTRTLASSGLLADELSQQLALVCMICLVWFAAEVVWSDRSARIDGITDATPASSGVFYLARLLTLWGLVLALTALTIVAALIVHLTHPHLPVEPLPYLGLFWFVAMPACLFAVAAVLLQVLAPNRWIGVVLTLIMAVLIQGGLLTALEHPMTRFTAAPGVSWSDLDGYGPSATSFAAFTAYWTVWSVLLGAVSWGAWRRGVETGTVARLRDVFRGRGVSRRVLLGSAVGVAGAAVALFSQTNVVHAWSSEADTVNWRVDYERAYRRLHGRPQPQVTVADLRVDFHPERRAAEVHGVLTLENRSGVAIDSVWIALRRDVTSPAVQVDGARLVRHDPRFGMWQFVLAQPLAAGASTALRYSLALERGGVRAEGFDRDAASNGSYLTMADIMPTFGYRPGHELQNLKLRAERQLGTSTSELLSPAVADSLAQHARVRGQSPAWLTLRARLSTSADQVAIGPGVLVREWTDSGRHHAEYRVESPMTPAFAFVSGRYAKRVRVHRGVAIEMWHHPAHHQNVDQILNVSAATLDLLGAELSPYRLPVLRVVEIPSGWRFGGYALTGMLVLTENRGVLLDGRAEDVNLLTRRVAHEVAHQWWGHTVSALPVPGGSTITETLAKHAERLVIQRLHGDSAVPKMLAFEHDWYLADRARESATEPTLLESTDASYIYYRKGALAMHALTDALGEPAVRRALAALTAAESGPNGAPTARALRDHLWHEAHTAADSSLITEWFGERVIYELSADSATAVARADSTQVTATFSVRRVTSDTSGETVRPADGGTVEVVVHGTDRAGAPVSRTQRLAVVQGHATLSMRVPWEPGEVEIDPRLLRIDRDRSNNQRRVTRVASDVSIRP